MPAPNPEDIALVVVVGGIVLGSISGMFLRHQRKMAELFHTRKEPEVTPAILQELQAMRSELQALKGQVNDITLAVDDQHSLRSRTQEVGRPPDG